MGEFDRHFGARMRTAVERHGPLCVGLDPSKHVLSAWGLDDGPRGLRTFCETCVEALAGAVGVVKPQSAFFERFGSAGVRVLEQTCALAREAGLLVILDAKRGDIGSTSAAYADAYLREDSPFACDALTISPYLGFESLRPLLDAATESGRGVFVLASTSNPEAVELQAARLTSGQSVQRDMWDHARAENQRFLAAHADEASRARDVDGSTTAFGPVGLVVGATITQDRLPLDDFNGFLLAPGLGAQGATAADIARLFRNCRPSALPSSSRDVLLAGPDRKRLAAKARQVNDELQTALRG
jgi:orotidine-5'-phosphate decarboxylase